jgi:hypothetical protein
MVALPSSMACDRQFTLQKAIGALARSSYGIKAAAMEKGHERGRIPQRATLRFLI